MMFRKEPYSSKWAGKIENQAYPLTLADMDFPLYEPFKKKLVEEIVKLNNLTYKDRSSQYYNALIQWYRKNHKVELHNQFFVQCPSLCNLIACCIIAFTQRHQIHTQKGQKKQDNLHQKPKVLIFSPVYSFYIKSIESLNCQVAEYSLKQVQLNCGDSKQNFYRYQFDSHDFQKVIDHAQPNFIILCHPHNPSGKIFSKEQLDFIVKKAQQHNSYILSDEIMGDFSLFPSIKREKNKNYSKFISLATYTYDRIIVGNSISKIFNCESVQGGYGIIKCQKTRQKYQKISKAFKFLVNQMSLILTPIVYSQDGQRWISLTNEIIQTNFAMLKETVSKQENIKLFDMQCSYLTTIEFDFKANGNYSISNKQLAAILAVHKIYFTDMEDYFKDKTKRNVFRISIAIHPDQFKKFIIRLKEFLHDMKARVTHEDIKKNLKAIQNSKL